MTKEGETIPYEYIFLSDAPLTTEEIYKGKNSHVTLGGAPNRADYA